jgi:phosphonate transport system substrate-binding protein
MAGPSQQAPTLLEAFQPILRMLKSETGREIRVLDAPDYAAVIESVVAGKVDIAEMGPFSYVQAKRRGAPITAVVARVAQKGEDPGYQSYGITRTSSRIKTIADFRGKKVCFGDVNSTSGYLYPKAALVAAGISLERDITKIFAGTHEAAILAVANGQCDAGFAYSAMVDRTLLERGQIQPGEITTVWRSETIPSAPIVVSDKLPAQLRRQLTTALQRKANADELRKGGFCQGECIIADGATYGFTPIDDSFYDSVRKVCMTTQEKICTKG